MICHETFVRILTDTCWLAFVFLGILKYWREIIIMFLGFSALGVVPTKKL
jgi:hypothetical protein